MPMGKPNHYSTSAIVVPSMPSSNSLTSFSERLAIKNERQKQAAERYLKFQIAQKRMDINQELALQERAYQHHRQSIADSHALQRFDNDQEKFDAWEKANSIIEKKNDILANQFKIDTEAQNNLDQTLMNINTSREDSLNKLYSTFADSPEKIDKLNEATITNYDNGNLDLRRIDNPTQFKRRAKESLIKQHVSTASIPTFVDTLAIGSQPKDELLNTAYKNNLEAEKEAQKQLINSNNKLETQGVFDPVSFSKLPTTAQLGNPWADSFKGWEIVDGVAVPRNDSEEIGYKEVIPALTQLSQIPITVDVIVSKMKDGKKVKERIKRTLLPTQKQLELAAMNAFVENAPGFANHYDADLLSKSLNAIVQSQANTPKKENVSNIVERSVRRRNKLAKDYADKKNSDDQIMKILFK